MSITIKSNHHWRPFLHGYELPEAIQNDFLDWMNREEMESSNYIHYKGTYYHIGEFMNLERSEDFPDWHGYHSDSAFSGVVIKISDDGDAYQIGTYLETSKSNWQFVPA